MSLHSSQPSYPCRRAGRFGVHIHQVRNSLHIYINRVDARRIPNMISLAGDLEADDPDFASDAFWAAREPSPAAFPQGQEPYDPDFGSQDNQEEWELEITRHDDLLEEEEDQSDVDDDPDDADAAYVTVSEADLRAWVGQLRRGFGAAPSAFDRWEEPAELHDTSFYFQDALYEREHGGNPDTPFVFFVRPTESSVDLLRQRNSIVLDRDRQILFNATGWPISEWQFRLNELNEEEAASHDDGPRPQQPRGSRGVGRFRRDNPGSTREGSPSPSLEVDEILETLQLSVDDDLSRLFTDGGSDGSDEEPEYAYAFTPAASSSGSWLARGSLRGGSQGDSGDRGQGSMASPA